MPSGKLSKVSFKVDMIIPREASDDLGQTAKGKTTFVRYELEICHRAPCFRYSRGLSGKHTSLTRLRMNSYGRGDYVQI